LKIDDTVTHIVAHKINQQQVNNYDLSKNLAKTALCNAGRKGKGKRKGKGVRVGKGTGGK